MDITAAVGKSRNAEVGDAGAFDDKTDEELMEEARNRAAALGLLPPETQH
jgi:hypothetical protein